MTSNGGQKVAWNTDDELDFLWGLGGHAEMKVPSAKRTLRLLRTYLVLARRRQWPEEVDVNRCMKTAELRMAVLLFEIRSTLGGTCSA